MRPTLLSVFLAVTSLAAGCTPSDETSAPAPIDYSGVTLQVAVVDDPAIAVAARKLQGEWNAQTGGEFDVVEMIEADLLEGKPLDVDVVIYPSYLLGPLVGRELLLAWDDANLDGDELAWDDIFELLRQRGARWGETVYAVPLGSPVLTCFYRADLFARFNRQPPRTWQEYHEAAKFFADRANLGDAAPSDDVPWSGTAEPLGPNWAALTLLARAAAYAKHPDYYSTLFNIETMEPLIAGPPFVRALEELAAAAKFGPVDVKSLDPARARALFWQGSCAMALSWPTGADQAATGAMRTAEEGESTAELDAGFSELPGSEEIYHPEDHEWKPGDSREVQSVPLLAISGRLISIAAKSEHPEAARRLIALLDGPQWGTEISSQSPATTLFRRSQCSNPQPWLDPRASQTAARQYADMAERVFSRQGALEALPIDGRDEYLAALDAAVHSVLKGQATPEEALRAAASRWRDITDSLGVEQQRRQYLQSLGLGP